jgi:hypothetical protein
MSFKEIKNETQVYFIKAYRFCSKINLLINSGF